MASRQMMHTSSASSARSSSLRGAALSERASERRRTTANDDARGDVGKAFVEIARGATPVGNGANAAQEARVGVIHLADEVERAADVDEHDGEEEEVEQHAEAVGDKVGPECDDARAAPADALVADVERKVRQRLHDGARQQRRLASARARARERRGKQKTRQSLATSKPKSMTTLMPFSTTLVAANERKSTSQASSVQSSAQRRAKLNVDMNATCAICGVRCSVSERARRPPHSDAHIVGAQSRRPVKELEKQQTDKHREELRVEVVAKDRHREQHVDDGRADFVAYLLRGSDQYRRALRRVASRLALAPKSQQAATRRKRASRTADQSRRAPTAQRCR